MFASGAKTSLKLNKNDVEKPLVQIRHVSAVHTKATTENSISRNVIRSKFKENNATKPSQIPFIENHGIRALKSSRESTSINIQNTGSQKSTESTVIAGKLSSIPKRDSRKDVYNSKKLIDRAKNLGSIRPKTSTVKAPNPTRSLSASNTLWKNNVITSNKQNPCKNLKNSNLKGEAIKTKTALKTFRSLSASNPRWKRNVKPNHCNENSKNFNDDSVPRENIEMAIQTNEGEILNHSLIVGDLKIMKPSKSVIDEIEKLRLQIKTKKLLKATRKFEEHSARDEEHLNDYKEFLEKSYVTKKERKVRGVVLEDDLKLIASMDELLNRQIPKTESITDIRARIKRKEEELMSLFDKIPNSCHNHN